MLSTEREEFEVHLAALFGAYDKPLTDGKREGYWLGLQKMPLPAIARVIEHATGPDGPTQLPNTKDLWDLHRKLRARAAPTSTSHIETKVDVDVYTAEGNLALFKFLADSNSGKGASAHALPRLVAEKNRIAAQYRDLAAQGEEVPASAKELVYLRAFERVYQPAGFDDVEHWRRQFARERGLEFVPRPRPHSESRSAA